MSVSTAGGRTRTISGGQVITVRHPVYGRVRVRVTAINPRGTSGSGSVVRNGGAEAGTSVRFDRREIVTGRGGLGTGGRRPGRPRG